MAIMDVRLFNIIILGLAFMFIFTAFQTSSMTEKTVLDSVDGGNFTGSGYTSLGILYGVFSLSNWAAPSVVSITGPKIAMVIGSLMYFLFVLQFLKPMVWALYLGSVLVGFGAAVLWTAQGYFLTINSDTTTASRNSGIFWALLQCSMLFGNLYSYFVFNGETTISDSSRTKLFIALSAASIFGSLLFLILRRPRPSESEELNINATTADAGEMPLTALKRSFELLKTRDMLLLCVVFLYTGVELTFFSGVYGTCISNNMHFGSEAKGLLGISGIFIGVGEILGGVIFGLFGKKTNVFGRDPIIMMGYIVHMVTFYLIFLNLPESSPIEESQTATYIISNKYVAILCSMLLGLGDSCFNTQIYSILASVYHDNSSPAFALFKFFQSIAAAVGFYYSNVLLLQWQLLILVIMGTVGTMCFHIAEWSSSSPARSGYQTI